MLELLMHIPLLAWILIVTVALALIWLYAFQRALSRNEDEYPPLGYEAGHVIRAEDAQT